MLACSASATPSSPSLTLASSEEGAKTPPCPSSASQIGSGRLIDSSTFHADAEQRIEHRECAGDEQVVVFLPPRRVRARVIPSGRARQRGMHQRRCHRVLLAVASSNESHC